MEASWVLAGKIEGIPGCDNWNAMNGSGVRFYISDIHPVL
jgi:hypothetical protein